MVPLSLGTSRAALACALAFCACLLLPSSQSHARPKAGKECRAAGPPGELETQGALRRHGSLQYEGEHFVVQLDDAKRPRRVRLLSGRGRSFELDKPPPFSPTQWLSRGRAIYALGTARSLEPGKVNVVLVRWGMDGRRPRTIRLWAQDTVTQGPFAASRDEHLAVAWVTRRDGRARFMVGMADLERTDIGEARALGKWTSDEISGHVMAGDGGFIALWSQGGKLRVARMDARGKALGKALAWSWKDRPKVASAAQCGGNLYALSAGKSGGARLLLLSGEEPREVAHIDDALDAAEMPLTCTGDAALMGHRDFNDKVGSVVFWITTVDASGKTRARRLKDMKGNPDSLRMPTLVGAGERITGWWSQREGARTKLFARAIGCR